MLLRNFPPPVSLKAMLALEYLTVILPLAACMVDFVDSGGRQLPPVYWNSSNPIFSSPNSVININLYESMEIFCPQYSPSSPPSNWEYYTIYFVSKQEYDSCRIFEPINATMVLNCSKPTFIPQFYFTLWIDRFQSFGNMPDFEQNKFYYLMTTSDGTQSGLSNLNDGACRYRNMRLKLNICCADNHTTHAHSTNPQPTPNTPQVTPSPTTRRPSTTTTTTTAQPTTTTRRTTTSTTTRLPSTKFPTKPVDPSKDNIIIDATGSNKNSGLINSARTLIYSHYVLTFSCLLTLIVLLLR
ncbi:hypothetical protein FSP39_010210 [Pinctada imbricata]|uniref:Ephrin RBD domain-containing protein n=1 Tax=Pinctada imbricata TaxID=66713 RepID=A0AA89BZC6_PINIB|nr:hypothetical protein FSP39_010210 [Pinctada imbricata]